MKVLDLYIAEVMPAAEVRHLRYACQEAHRDGAARYLEHVLHRRAAGDRNYLEYIMERVEQLRVKGAGVVASEVQRTLADAAEHLKGVPWVLIGGLAMGYHDLPRNTQDVDILLAGDIESIREKLAPCFKQIRPHSFEHIGTGVELEVLTPGFVSMPEALFADSVATAKMEGNVPVIDDLHLIGTKIGRGSYQDMADIYALLTQIHQSGRSMDFGYTAFGLSDEKVRQIEKIKQEVKEKQ